MIEWREEGFVLSTRKHGESSVIAEIFFASKGRYTGIVRGGTSRKMVPTLQPGTQVSARWKARLSEHLGQFQIEPIHSRTAHVLDNRLLLNGLSTLCAMLLYSVSERDPYPDLYQHSVRLLDLLREPDVWPLSYLQWEMRLLEALGYGLDLSACALKGTNEDLCYISPKTGRAVSRQAAGEWADRLLPLVPVLIGEGEASGSEISRALGVTGYFLDHKLDSAIPLPAARKRLLDLIVQLD